MGRDLDLTDHGVLRLHTDASPATANTVGRQAPASLAASYTLTDLPALPGSTQFITVDATGQLGLSTGSPGSLDDSYNIGRVITADAGPVEINASGAGSSALALTQALDDRVFIVQKTAVGAGNVAEITNDGTGVGLLIDQNGDASALQIDQDGDAIAIVVDQAQDSNIALLTKSGLGGGVVLSLQNLGTGQGIFIDQDGAGIGLHIDQDGAAPAIQIDQAAAFAALSITGGTATAITVAQGNDNSCMSLAKTGVGAGDVLFIDNDGTGNAIEIAQDGVAIALLVNQNTDQNAAKFNKVAGGTTQAVYIDNASDGRGLQIDQDGNNSAIRIFMDAAVTLPAIRVSAPGDTDAIVFEKTGTGFGNGLVLLNSGAGTGIFLNQDGTGRALDIDSEATGNPLIRLQPLASTNTRGDIEFGQRTASASSPAEGDMWYDGTNHRFEANLGTSFTRMFSSRFGPGFGPVTDVTISGGAVTVTAGHLRINGEGSVSDTLDNLTVTGAGPKDGDCILIRSIGGAVTITVSDGTGNIRLNGGANFAMNTVNDTITLMWAATQSLWIEQSSSNNTV